MNNVGGAYTCSSDSDTCIYKNVQCRNISVIHSQTVDLNNTAVNGLIRKTDWEISVGESS